MHIFPDLKKLEGKYGKELAVVGIHSAKFENEGATENIRKAAQRYGLEHPVANDNKFAIWNRYSVESWPTIVLIDPAGKFLGQTTGEGKYEILDQFISHTIKIFDEKKLIDRQKVIGKAEKLADSVVKFPAKIVVQPETKRLFIADTNNNRILVASTTGEVSAVIGNGRIGLADGDFATASFHMPHGIAAFKDTLYVADLENHAIRKIDLAAKKVEIVAGTGKQVWSRAGGPAKTTGLNSPWDLALSADGKLLYIAMAGDHRIWTLDLVKNEVAILAGNGHEDIVDGSFENSSFAQPSGLLLNGNTLYIADSEASGIRALDLKARTASTIIGFPDLERGRLFAFGDVDGKIGTAKLQHALGVAWYNGKIVTADTYNHKIKLIDPAAKTSVTFAGDGKPGKDDGKPGRFYEPGGIAVLGDTLFVADTNNHLIRTVDLKTKEVKTLNLKIK